MKRKILSLLLALALMCSFLPQMALHARAATSGQCGSNLRWSYDTSTGKLTITGSGKMDDYATDDDVPWGEYSLDLRSVSLPEGLTSIGSYAFFICQNVSQIIIPDSVTSIGEYAFFWCVSMNSVELPNGLKSIGKAAFGRSRLYTVTIPDSVTSIGSGAFLGCTWLMRIFVGDGNPAYCSVGGVLFNKNQTELLQYPCSMSGDYQIPATVTKIGDQAFDGCAELTDVTIPTSVTSIGDEAFLGCSKLKIVTIPASVRTIGADAFNYCEKLSNVTIPEGVTSIGAEAFETCNALKKVTIPDSVTNIGRGAFCSCAELDEISVGDGNPAYCTVDGVLFNKGKTELIQFPGKRGGKYQVPDTVTKICDFSFCGCESLTGIVLPKGVTKIGERAFEECGALTSINLPAGLTDIGEAAFADCSSLTKITIPDGIKIIQQYTFFRCQSLDGIVIPDRVQTIGEEAFYSCTGLKSVTIPENVTYLGALTFDDCSGLKQVTVLNAACIINGAAGETFGPKTTTVVGYKGSTAEQYAKQYGYPFKALDGEPEKPTKPEKPKRFVDVPKSSFCAEAVDWASENEITNGIDQTHFGPNETCTRGQVVTFLWRARGKEAPKNEKTAFIDVSAKAFYAKAVAWAVEKKVTAGTSKTTFSPEAGCTRGQVVTFLWRAAGCPEPRSKDNPFLDVYSGAFYYKAVLWAVENKITNGVTKISFAPDATCTRGQIVTFLYRTFAEK